MILKLRGAILGAEINLINLIKAISITY
jgi:hypothetical protein